MTLTLGNGYTMTTTFISDFAIADMYGEVGVKDTYEQALQGWKTNIVFLSEMVVALNLRGWKHYEEGRRSLSKLYFDKQAELTEFIYNNFQEEELQTFYRITD